MLYVPLDFKNNLTVDALVDSRAYVSAMAENDLDMIKQKASSYIHKIGNPPILQIQVAKGQFRNQLATAAFNFENGDNIFAELFVVMIKLTELIIGLHFVRNISVVIDTTHGLIHFPHQTIQVKTASRETNAEPQPVLTDD